MKRVLVVLMIKESFTRQDLKTRQIARLLYGLNVYLFFFIKCSLRQSKHFIYRLFSLVVVLLDRLHLCRLSIEESKQFLQDWSDHQFQHPLK